MMERNHFVSVAALVLNGKGEVCLIKSPDRGWEFPGGMVEPGETLEAAVVREVWEETGLHVRVAGFIGISKNIERDIVNVDFVCYDEAGTLTASEESLEVQWVSREEAIRRVERPVTRKRLQNMLSQSRNVFCFGFGSSPFHTIDDHEWKVGFDQ